MRDELTIPYENPENRDELPRLRNSPVFARRRMRRTVRQSPRAGFTLIEMMIALSVFLLLMVVVFVPLTQAVSTFNAGRADIELQQSAQLTMNQIEAELQKAIYVYPNDVLPGVTDRLPYKNDPNSSAPYYSGTGSSCDSASRTGNTSRLDFLVGAMNSVDNQLAVPVRAENYIVTYYGRRVDETKEYDRYENPIGLFRAQMPYYDPDSGTIPSGMNVSSTRYSSACNAGWLKQETHSTTGKPDEVNLEPYAVNDAGNVAAAHNLLTPSGIGLPAPGVSSGGGAPIVTSLTPDLSFICADVDSDGKIDRVTVNLALEQYETSTSGGTNGKPRRHVVRLSQTIDLPNVR